MLLAEYHTAATPGTFRDFSVKVKNGGFPDHKSLEQIIYHLWNRVTACPNLRVYIIIYINVYVYTTLSQTNMAPENQLLEDEFLSGKPYFQGLC